MAAHGEIPMAAVTSPASGLVALRSSPPVLPGGRVGATDFPTASDECESDARDCASPANASYGLGGDVTPSGV